MGESAALLSELDRRLSAGERIASTPLAQALQTWPVNRALPESWLLCDPSSLRPHPALELVPGERLEGAALSKAIQERVRTDLVSARDLLRTPLDDSAQLLVRHLSSLNGGRITHSDARGFMIVLSAVLANAPGQLSRAQALALMSELLELLQGAAELWNRQVVWLCTLALLLLVRERGLPAGPLRSWAEVGFTSAQFLAQRELCAALLLAGEGARSSPRYEDAVELLRAPKEQTHTLLLSERILLDAGELDAAAQLVGESLAQLRRFTSMREAPSHSEELFDHFDRERVALGFVRSVHGRAGLSLARLEWGLAQGSSVVLTPTLTSLGVYGRGACMFAPRVLELARTDPRSWIRARAWQALPAIVHEAQRLELCAVLELERASDPVAWVDAERSVASDMLLSGWAPAEAAR